MVEKKSVMVSFPGAALEMRNSFNYPDKDPVTRLPTGKPDKVAQCGVYLHIAGGKTVDVTGIDLGQLAAAYKELCGKPLAKELLAEIKATR